MSGRVVDPRRSGMRDQDSGASPEMRKPTWTEKADWCRVAEAGKVVCHGTQRERKAGVAVE